MKFYRYIKFTTVSANDDDYKLCIPSYNLKLEEFESTKETNKGYWIKLYSWSLDEKWISKSSKKRFAYPTKEEALLNFKKRTEKYIEILENKLQDSKIYLNIANKL